MADVIVVSKTDSAPAAAVRTVEENARAVNPRAEVILGALRISAEAPERLRGRKVLVVEDGPTLTHGGMSFGAATLLAQAHGAEIVDARRSAVGSIAEVYVQFPHLVRALPAMGYSPAQVRELETTIRGSDAELVLDGSPVNLAHLLKVPQPILNVRYEYEDRDGRLAARLRSFVLGRPSASPPRPSAPARRRPPRPRTPRRSK